MQTWSRFRRWLAIRPLWTAALSVAALWVIAIAGCGSRAAQSSDSPSDAASAEAQPSAVTELVQLPKNATAVEQAPMRLVLSVPAGKADSAVTALRLQFLGEGWDELSVVRKELTGTVSFVRPGQQLTLTYADTEAIPAEIVL